MDLTLSRWCSTPVCTASFRVWTSGQLEGERLIIPVRIQARADCLRPLGSTRRCTTGLDDPADPGPNVCLEQEIPGHGLATGLVGVRSLGPGAARPSLSVG
jgi:hypothetical protein